MLAVESVADAPNEQDRQAPKACDQPRLEAAIATRPLGSSVGKITKPLIFVVYYWLTKIIPPISYCGRRFLRVPIHHEYQYRTKNHGGWRSRRLEKDFLLRHDLDHATRHKEVSKAIESNLSMLQDSARSLGQTELVRQITSIIEVFGSYERHFASIVSVQKELGLNESSGLEGALRASIEAIEKKLNDFDDPRIEVAMLMMRRYELDFMLSHDPRYGEAMKKGAIEFERSLVSAPFPPLVKQDLAQKLQAYQRDFFAWMDAATVLAKEQRATLEAYETIDPVIEAVLKTVERIRDEAEVAYTASRRSVSMQAGFGIPLIILSV